MASTRSAWRGKAAPSVVMVVVGAGLLWGSTLTSFLAKAGAQEADLSLTAMFRPLAAALYVAMFLVALHLFRHESPVFTSMGCSWAMVALFVLGTVGERGASSLPLPESHAMLVAGMVMLQAARSYLDFAVFYFFVRLDSDIRPTCVLMGAAVAVLSLSIVSSLPPTGIRWGSTALAALAGVVLTLRLLPRLQKEPSVGTIDLVAPHELPLRRWAYLPYGFCTASFPSVSFFVLHSSSPSVTAAVALFACLAVLMFFGAERGKGLLAMCAFALAVAGIFALSVLGIWTSTLISCGYLFTYLGTCVLFSYGVPARTERWYADPMALVVFGYAVGSALSIAVSYAPLPAADSLLMAKALVAAFFGVAVPIFTITFSSRRAWAEGATAAGAASGSGQAPGTWAEPELQPGRMADVCGSARLAYGLTGREAQVLGYILQGFGEQYIADALVISKTTVHTHVRHIYTKMDVHSHDELAHLCLNGSASSGQHAG